MGALHSLDVNYLTTLHVAGLGKSKLDQSVEREPPIVDEVSNFLDVSSSFWKSSSITQHRLMFRSSMIGSNLEVENRGVIPGPIEKM